MPRTCITPGCRHDSTPGRFARYCRGCIRQMVREETAEQVPGVEAEHIEVERRAEGRSDV